MSVLPLQKTWIEDNRMNNETLEAIKIINGVRSSLAKGDKYFDTQYEVQTTPGVFTAVGILAKQWNADPDTMRLALQMGVYITIVHLENKRLERILGDIK
jgi:hypothetical protein